MTEPKDAELDAVLCNQWPAFSMQATLVRVWVRAAMRDALAKWGTPAGAGEVAGWINAGELLALKQGAAYAHVYSSKQTGASQPVFTTPQPTQEQAGAVPLTVQYPEGYGNPFAKIAYDAGWLAAEHAHGIKGADHG